MKLACREGSWESPMGQWHRFPTFTTPGTRPRKHLGDVVSQATAKAKAIVHQGQEAVEGIKDSFPTKLAQPVDVREWGQTMKCANMFPNFGPRMSEGSWIIMWT